MENPKLAHRPYIPAQTRLPEFTLRAVLAGTILGIIFGASSLYLVLKVGLTVSASIPVAVISITLFRMLLVAVLGGLLGILMMIPLRRALIVNQHGELKYPEGTACAEVLKAGSSAESRAAADPLAVDKEAGGI